MRKVFITGHKNPDMDSVCAAYAYSVLKSKLDPDTEYSAIRCGHLTQTVKKHFESLGINTPPYMRDIFVKVSDVMRKPVFTVQAKAPIFELVKIYSSEKPSVVPVFDGDTFKGLLSVDDISSWFLKDNSENQPVYTLTLENIQKVIPGYFVKKGKESFEASLLAGAAEFDQFTSFLDQNENSLIVTGYRPEHIMHSIKRNVPAIIISACKTKVNIDTDGYQGSIFCSEMGTAEILRRLRMAQEVQTIMGKQEKPLSVDTTYNEAKDLLVSSNLRGLSVFDGDCFVGYVTRRCFLEKPKYNVIMVDHNEPDQSIKGIETANVIEIIDHHRLDSLKTDSPIFIDAEPLGSTCTIIYQQFLRNNIIPDSNTAKVLLSGIIADTVILRSPTTTITDRVSAGSLGALCSVFDIEKFGKQLFSLVPSIKDSNPADEINADFKVYKESGVSFGIGQCETTTLADFDQYSSSFTETIKHIAQEKNLDWAMVMITDVLTENSILISSPYRCLDKLPYTKLSENIFNMPKVLSRKKQLLPEIIHSLE